MKKPNKEKLYKKLLKEVQALEYHYPDSDAHEYCAGCGRSPYNDPPHSPNCIVVRIAKALKE